MSLPSRLSFVALAVLAGLSGPAAAQQPQTRYNYFQVGFGAGNMNTTADPHHNGIMSWMAGYRFNANFALEFAGHSADSPYHSPYISGPPVYDFFRYNGVQALAIWPITSAWDLSAILGEGRADYGTRQPGYTTQHQTDTLVGFGLRWQALDHFAISTNTTRVVNARSLSTDLAAEFDF